MTLPLGSETLTLVHREEQTDERGKTHITYVRHTLHGCSWRRTERVDRDFNGQEHRAEEITARIPLDALENVKPLSGDALILGEYSALITGGTLAQLIEARKMSGGAMVVSSVTDNTVNEGIIPHYKCR